MKSQEIKELTKTFELETNRLKDVLDAKERMIESQAQDMNREKVRTANLTREY